MWALLQVHVRDVPETVQPSFGPKWEEGNVAIQLDRDYDGFLEDVPHFAPSRL